MNTTVTEDLDNSGADEEWTDSWFAKITNGIAGDNSGAAYLGCEQVTSNFNFYGQFHRQDASEHTFSDESREAKLPSCQLELNEAFVSALKPYRDHYCKHRWLIIERNLTNSTVLTDHIAALFDQEQRLKLNYRLLTEDIDYQDYLRHADILTYSSETLTRVVVDKKGDELVDFFSLAENVEELPETLRKSRNTLIFDVDSDQMHSSIDRLVSHLPVDIRVSAVWCPLSEQQDAEPSLDVDKFRPVQRYAIILAIWFHGLPFSAFRSLLQILHEQLIRCVSSPVESSESEWQTWLSEPDKCLTELGLKVQLVTEHKHTGVVFAQSAKKPLLREYFLQNWPLAVGECSEIVKAWLLGEGTSQIEGSHWAKNVSWDLALFLGDLANSGILNIDDRFLLELYEQVRLDTTGDEELFFRFLDLIGHLYHRGICKQSVSSFIRSMGEAVVNEEAQLWEQAGQNRTAINALPRQMAELAYQKANNSLACQLYRFKDRTYATCVLLEKAIGISQPLAVKAYDKLIFRAPNQHSFPIAQGIATYRLEQALTSSADNLISLVQQASLQRKGKPLKALVSLASKVLGSKLTEAADERDKKAQKDAFKYLLSFISKDDGSVLLELLKTRISPRAEKKTTLQCTRILIHALIPLHTYTLQRDSESSEVEKKISAITQNWAQNLPTEEFLTISGECTRLREETRLSAVEETDRKDRIRKKAISNSCLFIKKSFKRTREKTDDRHL